MTSDNSSRKTFMLITANVITVITQSQRLNLIRIVTWYVYKKNKPGFSEAAVLPNAAANLASTLFVCAPCDTFVAAANHPITCYINNSCCKLETVKQCLLRLVGFSTAGLYWIFTSLQFRLSWYCKVKKNTVNCEFRWIASNYFDRSFKTITMITTGIVLIRKWMHHIGASLMLWSK